MQLVNGKLTNSTECNLNSMLRRVGLLLGTRKLQAYDQVSSLEPFAKPVLKTDFNDTFSIYLTHLIICSGKYILLFYTAQTILKSAQRNKDGVKLILR